MAEEPTFEQNLAQLEQIVANLEQGNVPLEAALDQFKQGVTLSRQLEKTLKTAEQTVTQMVKEDGTTVDFAPDTNA